jgi:hypothetical protein
MTTKEQVTAVGLLAAVESVLNACREFRINPVSVTSSYRYVEHCYSVSLQVETREEFDGARLVFADLADEDRYGGDSPEQWVQVAVDGSWLGTDVRVYISRARYEAQS